MAITLSITSAGVPWSAAELARITPDPEAPLCSVQQQLEAIGYRVTAIQGLGMEVSAEVERPVTAETCGMCGRKWLRSPGLDLNAPGLDAVARVVAQNPCRCFDLALARAALEHNLRGGRS